MLSTNVLLGEILKLPYWSVVYKEFAKVTDRSTRQVSDYFRKKDFSLGSELKIKRWLKEQGIEFFDDLPSGAGTAASWMGLAYMIQKNSQTFLPKTIKMLQELAEKDITLLRSYKGVSQEDRLQLYKKYLKKEVVPFCCDNPEESIVLLDQVEKLDHLHQFLPRLFVENTLHLLAHAEAEYLLDNFQDHSSVLANCVPSVDDTSTTPSKQFFVRWMNSLHLDRKGILKEMFKAAEESGISDEDWESNDDEMMTYEALEKQIQRYLKEGKRPTLETISTWAKGLYWKSTETQGRDEGYEHYSAAITEIYSGILVLDRLFEEGKKRFQHEDLCQIMGTYQNRFDSHLAAMKKGAEKMSTPT